MREVEQRPELRAGAGPAGVAAPVDPDQDGQQRGVLVRLSQTCKRCLFRIKEGMGWLFTCAQRYVFKLAVFRIVGNESNCL